MLISLNTFSKIESLDRGQLLIYHHVREDGETLYGFFEKAEKDLFVLLLSVSGVGAGTARMMLSSMKADEISRAILNGNTRLLEASKELAGNRPKESYWNYVTRWAKICPNQIFPH